MLEGITVLTQTEYEDASLLWLFIPFFVVMILITITGAIFSCDDWVVPVAVLVGLAFGIICYVQAMSPTGEYRYEVMIDESVSMTDFYERYDVIDQRGKIYKIKEKNDD
jgi:hypothetical protein